MIDEELFPVIGGSSLSVFLGGESLFLEEKVWRLSCGRFMTRGSCGGYGDETPRPCLLLVAEWGRASVYGVGPMAGRGVNSRIRARSRR